MKNLILFVGFILSLNSVQVACAQEVKDSFIEVEINKGKMVKFPSAAASVVVADPTTADIQVVSPKTIFVYGKKIGETSISAVDDKDDAIFQSVVTVTHNLSSLERTVKRVSPTSNVSFKTVDGGLVIDGSTVSVQEAESIKNVAVAFVGANDKVVNMMKTGGGDQVSLQVRIVEMARTDLKNLGVNLGATFNGSELVSQVVSGAVSASAINPARAGNFNLQNSYTRGSGTINSLIEALETQGLATVLAEPSLTTSTGKPASFLAGGQYPIPVAGSDRTVTVQYQPFGVSLNFTPIVMSNDRMSILVNPEVSTLNFSNPIQVAGFTYPILDTRKAQATVELGSGQTFVLAGLLRNDTSNNISKLPGVGDIPVLGSLFRSQRFQNNQTELVILVTPYIVRPISEANKAQTPIDGYKAPTDAERLILGSLYQQQDMVESAKDKAKQVVRSAPVSEQPPVAALTSTTVSNSEAAVDTESVNSIVQKTDAIPLESGKAKQSERNWHQKSDEVAVSAKGEKALDKKMDDLEPSVGSSDAKLNGENGFILE